MHDEQTHSEADSALLARWASNRDQRAFEILIRRHLDWVFASALRQVRDPHLAEDVTQATFSLLVRKARVLTHHAHLTGWLFRAVRLLSLEALRAHRRRRRHESHLQELHMRDQLTTPHDQPQADWSRMEQVLDASVARLRESDRRIILLRFYQRLSHRAIATHIGITEDAAKMRLSRALERLRKLLPAAASALPLIALDRALWSNAAPAAPHHLVSQIVQAGFSPASASLPWLKGLGLVMSLKKVAAVVIVLALASSIFVGAKMIGRRTPPCTDSQVITDPVPTAAPSLEGPWRPAFDAIYRLEPHQSLKLIKPPYIKQRTDFYTACGLHHTFEAFDPKDGALYLAFDTPRGKAELRNFSTDPATVSFLLSLFVHEDGWNIRIPRQLDKRMPGDWIFRKQATPEQLVDALRECVRKESGLSLKFSQQDLPREVLVLTGSLKPGASVQIYADRMDGGKPFNQMHSQMGLLLHQFAAMCSRPIINQSSIKTTDQVAWAIHESSWMEGMPPSALLQSWT